MRTPERAVGSACFANRSTGASFGATQHQSAGGTYPGTRKHVTMLSNCVVNFLPDCAWMQIGLLCGTDLTGLMPPAHRSTSKWHIIAWQSCARNAAEVKLLGNAALCIVCCFAVPQPFKSSTETRRANAAPRVALVLPFLVPISNAWHAEMRGNYSVPWWHKPVAMYRRLEAAS